MRPVNNLKILAYRAVAAPPASDGSSCPTRRDANTVNCGELKTSLFEKASARMNTDGESLTAERVASDPVVESLVDRSEVRDMMEDALSQLNRR